MLDVNTLTDDQFRKTLQEAIQTLFAAKNRVEREDASNDVMALINLRANGDKRIYRQWMTYYDDQLVRYYA